MEEFIYAMDDSDYSKLDDMIDSGFIPELGMGFNSYVYAIESNCPDLCYYFLSKRLHVGLINSEFLIKDIKWAREMKLGHRSWEETNIEWEVIQKQMLSMFV